MIQLPSEDLPIDEQYYVYLESLPLTALRILARRYGIAHATIARKCELTQGLVDIFMGKRDAEPPSKRGAPPKYTELDPAIYAQIEEIGKRKRAPLSVHEPVDPPVPPKDMPLNSGILEITANGYGFVRAKNCQPSADGDVFIPSPAIHNYRLREGDHIVCSTHPRVKNDSAALETLYYVNGLPIGKYERRPLFDSLTATYATEKFELSDGNEDLSLRVLDLFAPIGRGQRALIIAPPKAGKTTLLKTIARAISENYSFVSLIVLLIDERPEEVTDLKNNVKNAEVIFSTFDDGADHHIRAAELTLAHAKRLAELGKDVVILLDSLTKLTRAYNYTVESSGKTLSGGLDAGAFAEPKRFFGAARNTEEGGSITILATALVETGSRMDDIIYEEFKGTGNSDIFLSRDLAERRIFPAIDIRRSGTRKEELLLSPEELAAVYKMRERGLTDNIPGLFDMMRKTSSNRDFIAKLPEWLRVFKVM